MPEGSLSVSMRRGGREFYGWDENTYILADLFDALNTNTVATGNFKKPPKLPDYPRPSAPVEKPPATLAAWHSIFKSAQAGDSS